MGKLILTGMLIIAQSLAVADDSFLHPGVHGANAKGVSSTKLPINGVIRYTDNKGSHIYVSEGGRFVFKGEFIDMWSGQEVGDAELSNKIDLGSMNYNKAKNLLRIGNPKGDALTIILDPNCGNCTNVMNRILVEKWHEKYSVELMLLSHTQEGRSINKSIWCSTNPLEAIQYFYQGKGELPVTKAQCDITPLALNDITAKTYGLRALPAMIKSNGHTYIGNINNLTEILGNPS
jgi:thiol:disulfide interchange protein DsbC